MACGIYQILNCVNGKSYIGQAQNIPQRWRKHRELLNRRKHHCSHLQHAWDKHGESSFRFRLLEECEISSLDEREQHYLDLVFGNETQYNICSRARSSRGVATSDETRRKKSIAAKEVHSRPGMKEKLQIAQKIAQNRPEVREKRRIASIGATRSESARAHMKEAQNRHEVRDKISKATTGENNPNSKLTLDDVNEIRALLKVATVSLVALSRAYNVSTNTIGRIKHNIGWKVS